jgi:hypothetical protein
MLLAFLAALAGYLVFSVPGTWFPAAQPKAFPASGLGLTRGTGALVDGELRMTAPDAAGIALVSQVTDLKASDYAAVQWIATDLPEGAVVRLIWRTDLAPTKLNAMDIPVESRSTLPVIVAGDPAWTGRVTGLALAIQGALPQPVRIRGVVAKPMGAAEIFGDRASEWFALEEWSGTSINTVNGGADVQGFPLPLLLTLTLGIAGAMGMLATKWRPRALDVAIPVALGAAFLIAWFILDARWTVNLARQAWHTAQQFAGKSPRDKYLASDDAQLFAFIDRARPLLPAAPARIFVAADASYFRGRAAYHLYPNNVFFDPLSNETQWSGVLRPGDWVVVFQQRGIQYDAARQMLRWKSGETTPAELKLLEAGGALFRVR